MLNWKECALPAVSEEAEGKGECGGRTGGTQAQITSLTTVEEEEEEEEVVVNEEKEQDENERRNRSKRRRKRRNNMVMACWTLPRERSCFIHVFIS